MALDKLYKDNKGRKSRLRKKYHRSWLNQRSARNNYHKDDIYGNRVNEHVLKRFIHKNIGRPVNDVYSEFVKKCSRLKKYGKSLHDIFYGLFKEENIIGEEGGFYLEGGIIKEREHKSKGPSDHEVALKYNSDFIEKNKDKIIKLGLKASQDGYPKYIGKLYVSSKWPWKVDLHYIPIYIMEKDILPLENLDLKTRHHNYSKAWVIGYELGLKLENDGSLGGIRYYSDRPKEGGELFALVKKTI